MTVDRKLRLRPSPELDKRLRAAFTYPNPDHKKAKGLGLFYLPPPNLQTWELERGELCLPRGGAAKLRAAASALGQSLTWIDRRVAARVTYPSEEEARNYLAQHEIALIDRQEQSIQALLARENAYLRAATGCLSGDAIIEVNRAGKSFKISIAELVDKFNRARPAGRLGQKYWDSEIPTMLRSRADDGFIRLHRLAAAVSSGVRQTFILRTEKHHIRATADHQFLTSEGWKRLGELTVGDRVFVDIGPQPSGTSKQKKPWYQLVPNLRSHPFAGRRNIASEKSSYSVPRHRLVVEAILNKLSYKTFIDKLKWGEIEGLWFLDPMEWSVHHIDRNEHNQDPSNLMILSRAAHQRLHGKEDRWQQVTSRSAPEAVIEIRRHSEESTFDLCMESEPRNFLANGFVVHNSGKTLMVLEAIRRTSQRCLFLVPDNGIAAQTLTAAKKLLGAGYAQMLSSKLEPDDDLAHILVATYAMAWRVVSKVPALGQRLQAQVGALVCDEMQFASARTVHAVVEFFPARYRWGCSADLTRKDSMEFKAMDSFGQLADHISVQEAVDEGRILHARLIVARTGVSDPDYEDCAFGPNAARTPEARRELYRVAEELVRTDPSRNALIAARVVADWRAGHSCLVLAYRIEHCELIAQLIAGSIGGDQVCILRGGPGQKRKFDDLCDQLRARDLRCAVGTPKAYQGLDVPVLDRGYIAVPKATNPQQLEQMMGRFRRVAPGKVDAEVVYFWDERLFPGHKRKLVAQYKDLCTVEGDR